MSTTETQETTATEAQPSLDERIQASFDAKAAVLTARQGDATESATAEEKESSADDEAAAEAESSKTDEAEGDAKAEEQEEKPDVRAFTAEELENPKTFYSLDKKGWSDLEAQHPQLAAGWKAIIAENTRRERKVADRERALAERETTTTAKADTKPAATVNRAELIDALNDPDRVDEAVEKFADLPGFEKAIDRYLEKKGVKVDALANVSKQDALQAGFALVADTLPELRDDAIAAEIDNEPDPDVKSLLESDAPQAVAAGLKWAVANAKVRLALKPAAKKAPDAKAEQLDAAKTKARAAVAKQKVTPSAALEAGKQGVTITPSDKSIPLEKRIEQSLARNAEALRARGGVR